LEVKAITPDVLTGKVNGDVYDRIIVRLLEVVQSVQIIEQCLDKMPSGEIIAEKKLVKLLNQLKKAKGEGIGRHEAPRGEVFHYVKLSEAEVPEVWKARAPTYNNLMTWVPMLLGQQIADIPIVVASIDPCIACMDRVTILNKNNDQKSILTKKDLHELSVQKTRRITP
jgi:membrane-bound hydrogenase subunit alpha